MNPKLLILTAFLAALCLAGQCTHQPPDPVPPPRPVIDGGGGADDCERACNHLIELRCEFPFDAGAQCADACRNLEESGITMCPARVAEAKTCEAAMAASQCEIELPP